jgi:hypothetical protein
MLRTLSEGAALFLLPFVLYAAFLLVRTQLPFVRDAWGDATLVRLTAAGLVLAILGFVVLGLFGDRHLGAYRPAHIENGRVVPGHMD